MNEVICYFYQKDAQEADHEVDLPRVLEVRAEIDPPVYQNIVGVVAADRDLVLVGAMISTLKFHIHAPFTPSNSI